jgi:hypothetical protein
MGKMSANEEECRRTMAERHFDQDRRLAWFIWAAKMRDCPSCSRGPGQQCVHLGELRRDNVVFIKWPHEQRVDWTRMLQGLVKRGYTK